MLSLCVEVVTSQNKKNTRRGEAVLILAQQAS